AVGAQAPTRRRVKWAFGTGTQVPTCGMIRRMRTRAPLTLVLAASALFAASCSSASDLSEPEAESSSPAVEKDANYSTIEEFRDAAIEAGLECPSWAERTGSTYAAAAGDCSDSTVLSIFSSESQRDEQVA